MELTDRLSAIKGIGPKKEKMLADRGLRTVDDLLHFFPRGYEDRRSVTSVRDAVPGQDALIEAYVVNVKISGNPYSKKAPLSVLADDGSGQIEIVFFGERYLAKIFKPGARYTFFGKVTENYTRKQMIHPTFISTGSEDDFRGVLPIYPAVEGVSQRELRRLELAVSPLADKLAEWIPEDVVRKYKLASPAYAVKNIHFPADSRKVRESRYRLVFEELYTMETGLMVIRGGIASSSGGAQIDCRAGDSFADRLPFELTPGQKEAWEEIRADLESEKRMNRLLQGDVGSGKTVIAEMAMYSAARNGFQSVIMAPTELLADQHYETFTTDLADKGVKIALLTSASGRAEKKRIIEGLADGSIDILIATHAVLQENVKFSNLGLVITDEQHRFGVEQRRTLSAKGRNANILVMTATPIPRTLAVILYGDLDISQIKTMPAGRKPISTTVVTRDMRGRVYDFVGKQVAMGRQAYVIAPLIENSEKIDAVSAGELYKEVSERFPERRVALVHGAMRPAEKDEIMRAFERGETDILVSTVVVEVGINVKNATVMVIENAERFGLAQLHQLRGRVGRGGGDSYCFLVTDDSNELAMKRAEIMSSTTSGFDIAEEDLKLRGPGEIFGTRQHGLPTLEIADLVRHKEVLEDALEAAKETTAADPGLKKPEHAALRERVEKMFGGEVRLDL